MADIISRLRLESGEFDSKIKRAGQELMAYSEHCRKTGLQMGFANKDARDFVQSLGNMQTTSTTARGKINELSDAFVNLRVMYKQMTDEEKNNQFGKNLAASLDQLKTRIIDAKKDLSDVTAELNGASSVGKGGFLSGIGDKMGGALQVFAGNMLTKGVTMLTSELAGSVQQSIELARQGEGIRMAFERLNQPGLLDNLKEATHGTVSEIELMKQAVKFDNFKLPVEELGTMLAFAQQKAKDTGQSVDYMVDSIVTGLGRKSLMILDNLGLSATEIRERIKETGDMTKAVGAIIRDQMQQAGDYVETAADRAAQANVSLQNKMEELGRKFAPLEEASNNFWTSMKIGILDVVGGPLATLLNKLTKAGRLMNAYGQMGGSGKVGRMISILASASEGNRQSIYQQQQERFWRYINPREQQIKDILAWQRGERREALQKRIGAIRDKYGSLDITKIQAEIDAAKKMLSEYQQDAELILTPVKADVDIKGAEQSVESLKVKLIELQAQRKKAIAAGDTDLSKNLAKQISQVKADIIGLGGSTTTTAKKEQTELQQNQTRINELTQQYVTLMAAASEAGKPLTDEQQKQTSEIRRQISDLEKRNGQLKLYQEQAKGKLLGPDAFRQQLSVNVAVNNKKIEELEKQLISLDGVTIDTKSVKVTAETDEARQKVEELEKQLISLDGITVDPKSVKVTAETDEARQKVEELKRQITELKDQNIQITAAMGSIGMPLSEIPRMGVTDVTYGKGNNQYVPAPLMPSMDEVVRQRGGNLLDKKAMKAVNEDISKNLPNTKEKDSPLESGKKLLSGISQLTDGLEKIGIDIPDEVQAVIGVIQGVMQVIEAVNTIIGVTQTTALTANTVAMGVLTEALWANTATSFFGFANGGIVPKFADGGLVGRAALGIAIPGNSMSGDNLRLPVDGGRGVIGVNSGEVILNRAQQGVIASDLDGGGASQNLKLDAVISGEQIRLVLNNNGRRTGRGEYVQSTRRR